MNLFILGKKTLLELFNSLRLVRILRLLNHRMDSKPFAYKYFCDFELKS